MLRNGRILRPQCAVIDPRAQHADFVGAQSRLVAFFRRHEFVRVEASDELHQRTLRTFSNNDRRVAGVAALQCGIAGVEAVAALLLLRPVAGDAVLLQDRAHVLCKIHVAFCRRRKLRAVQRNPREPCCEDVRRDVLQEGLHVGSVTRARTLVFGKKRGGRGSNVGPTSRRPKGVAAGMMCKSTMRRSQPNRIGIGSAGLGISHAALCRARGADESSALHFSLR